MQQKKKKGIPEWITWTVFLTDLFAAVFFLWCPSLPLFVACARHHISQMVHFGCQKTRIKKDIFVLWMLCIHAHTVVTQIISWMWFQTWKKKIVINIHLLKYYFFIYTKKNDICKSPKSNIVTAFNIYIDICAY